MINVYFYINAGIFSSDCYKINYYNIPYLMQILYIAEQE